MWHGVTGSPPPILLRIALGYGAIQVPQAELLARTVTREEFEDVVRERLSSVESERDLLRAKVDERHNVTAPFSAPPSPPLCASPGIQHDVAAAFSPRPGVQHEVIGSLPPMGPILLRGMTRRRPPIVCYPGTHRCPLLPSGFMPLLGHVDVM
jgi:hypothetical protein